MKVRIAGILCDIEPDENDFVDIYIAEGQKLLPEWIVRGALDLAAATTIARAVIKERLAGHTVIHDREGGIYWISDPYNGPEHWKKEYLSLE
jgi:hypothetical protein